MFPKLIAVIVAIGVCGCTLLALRQSRLQAASELAQTQLRIASLDERLWVMRVQIAQRITPQRIEEMAVGVGPLKPMIADESWDTDMVAQQSRPHETKRIAKAPTRVARGGN